MSFGAEPNIVEVGLVHVLRRRAERRVFFDYDGIKDLFDTSGGRNFTAPHLGGESPWTGVDSNTEGNVFATVDVPVPRPTASHDELTGIPS